MEPSFIIRGIISFLPFLAFGVIFGFFPHRIIQIRAKIELGMFYSLGYKDEDIDRLPIQSAMYGKNYSKRLKAQIETPKEFRALIIWARMIGFFVLFIACIAGWIAILAIRTGNYVVQ